MRQQCINSAEKAIGRSFNDGEVDFVDAAIARAGADLQAQDPDAWNQMSPAEQWRAAGQRAAEVMRAEAQQLVEQAEGGAQIEETRRPEGEAFGQSAVELQRTPPVITGTGPGGRVLNRDLGQFLTDRHMAKYGRALDPDDPADYEIILNSMLEDYAEQSQQPDTGDAWYTDDINEAIRLTSAIYPALQNSPPFKNLFLTVAALLSPQQKPVPNWDNAVFALRSWEETGRLELLKPNGKQFGVLSHTNGLRMLQYLIDTLGLKSALLWVQTEHTGREMAEMRMASGIFAPIDKATEAVSTKVKDYLPSETNLTESKLGIYAFGPKVGDFMQNSAGIDQSAVTVDLWLARTYNRYIGRLMDVSPKQAEEGAIASELRGRGERDNIKRLVRDAAAKIGLDASAMQAALWYFEQRLYRNFGIKSDSQNFSGAARTALERRGIDVPEPAESDQRIAGQNVGQGDGAGDVLAQPGQDGRPEQTGDGRRRYSSGGLAPLEGAPRVNGATGPDPGIVAVAEQYAAANGIDLRRQARYAEVNVELATRIAQAYEEMQHAPLDPAVQEAYANLKRQTRAQYDALVAAGYTFDFFDSNTDPYQGNPSASVRDLRANKHMSVYGTYDGYGTEGITGAAIENNPMLEDTGLQWPDQAGVMRPVTANDLFRAVHDAFGHSLEGAGFRARGEENAWQAHIRLYTGTAIHAATSETRGQNSWLNYGPHGETNRTAGLGDTVFALQKTGLMPAWTWTEGVVEDMPEAPGAFAARGEGQRIGEYYPALTEIRLGPQSNMSTFLHEMGHHFLEVHVKVAMSLLDRQAAGETLTDRQLQHIRDMEFAIGEMARQAGEQPAPPEAEGDVVSFAAREGYEGSDPNEAASWLRAKAKGLDMSLKARMERALAMGFDTSRVLYHGTGADISAFSLQKAGSNIDAGWLGRGIYMSSSPTIASYYTSLGRNVLGQGNVMPLLVAGRLFPYGRKNKGIRGEIYGEPSLPPEIRQEVLDRAGFQYDPNAEPDFAVERRLAEAMAEVLQERGFAGVEATFKDGGSEVVIFDPANIRSIFAAFDPDEAASADLLAQEESFGAEGPPGGEPPQPGPTPPPGADLIRWFNGLTIQERTAMHEVWARMTERYFMEGKAPTPALDNLFSVFKDWLGKVYRSMTDLNVELSDEVREVMDRLYVAQGNTQRAEEALGFKPAFTTKPAFMTEQEWRSYQELGRQATQEATADLGARTLGDMQWLGNAKSRELRKLQAQHRKLRNAIKAQVTEEIADLPVNRARRFIARGIGPDGQPIPGPHKLSIGALRAQFGESLDWQSLGYGKYGMLAETGLDADTLAGMLGYDSGQALVTDLLTQPKQQDAIEAETDHRMQMQSGDTYTPQQMERQALDAVHNGLRGRFLAAQHAALAKAVGKRSLLRENARAAAEIIVGRQTASKLSAKQAIAAERKAGRAVLMALKKNDLEAAATASRDQLLAFEITAETLRQQKAYQSARALFRRVRAGKKENVAKNRNFDLVMAARAILSAFGEGTERQAEEIEGYIKAVQNYDPALYANIEPAMTAAIRNPKPLDQLSVTELTGLRDTIQGLYDLAREQQLIVVAGRTMNRETAVNEVVARLQVVTKTKPQRGLNRAPTQVERDMRAIAGLGSWLRRVESWARQADGGRTGPFTRLIWRPISQAADQYRIARNDFIARYRALFDQIAPTMKPGRIDAPEIGFSFENKSQLLHAILHTGNASNKRKLLLGYGWGTLMPDGKTVDDSRWRAMINRMAADGTLTQADFDFAQSVWDLLEETKPLAQEAHRRVFGRYFNEITAEAVVTPFGTYRGGYVPAIYDPQTSANIATKAELELREDSRMFPAPANGFTLDRNNYTGEMHLNLLLLSGHIDKVLKFTYMAAPVRDVLSVLKDKKVSEALQAYDPTAFVDMLDPWLYRAARQIVETPTTGTGGKAIDAFFRGLRRRSGMGLMFMNLVNVVQQVTSFSLAAVRVPPHRLAQGLARYMLNPKSVTDGIRAASLMMRERGDNQASGIFGEIEQIIDPNNKYKQLTMWFARHTYFMQIAFQNVIDVVVWQGAYDDATARGETHDEAVAQADGVVRQTQSSTLPEDISRAEAGNVGLRLFTHMYNYFNMNANLLATESQIAIRDMGLKKGAGRLLYLYFLGFAIPSVVGQIIVDAMRGQLPEDEEDDGYLNDWLTYTLETQGKYFLGFVPIVGQAVTAGFNALNDKPYDDRVGTSPAVSIVESAVRTPSSVYKAIMEEGDQSRAAKDLLNTMTLLTGIPFSAASRPIGYALDVEEGDVDPVDELDYARGLVTGSASEASKQ
jgi:hypothetical protein